MGIEELRDALVMGNTKKKPKRESEEDTRSSLVYLGKHSSFGLVKQCISTQAPYLDRILAKDQGGSWGLPVGRMVFIAGKPGSGKSTLCLHVCAETQRKGGMAFYFDSEQKLDRKYAAKVGVDIDTLIYSNPLTLEEMLETIWSRICMVRKFHRNKEYQEELFNLPITMIIDSTSAATRAEREGGMSRGGLGEHARTVSEFLRKIEGDVADFNILMILVCQIKSKINIGYGGYSGGPKETFLAEDAISFHSTIGLRTQRIKTIKDSDNNKIGDVVLFRTIKNQVAPPFREATADLFYGKGLDYYTSLCDLLLEFYGARKQPGGNYSLKKLGLNWRTRSGLKAIFNTDPAMKKKVLALTRKPVRVHL